MRPGEAAFMKPFTLRPRIDFWNRRISSRQGSRFLSFTGPTQLARTNSWSPMIAASFLRSCGSGARSSAGLRVTLPPKPDRRSVI